ncbi:hypothetical protein ACFFIY_13390 [Bhargavaea ullalensis]|uniref:Uncharacterized protein n=1 Tax=Bhargavaea ullalensis TaxID=1265685 RepID=A0ABV2G867_9BACL
MKTRTIGRWTIRLERPLSGEHDSPCDCLYCLNFRKAVKDPDPQERGLFDQLGIDPERPGLLSDFPAESGSGRYYIGHYELAGRLLDGPPAAPEHWTDENTEMIGRFRIGFSGAPELRLEFEAVLPWLLSEPPED